ATALPRGRAPAGTARVVPPEAAGKPAAVCRPPDRRWVAMGNIGGRSPWLHAVPILVLLAAALLLSSQSYQQQSLLPWLSSDTVSEKLTAWLDGVRFDWNGREMSVQSVGALNRAEFIHRKVAHPLLYAGLAFTLLLAFRVLLPWRKWASVTLAAA